MKWKNVLMFVLNMAFLLSAAFAFWVYFILNNIARSHCTLLPHFRRRRDAASCVEATQPPALMCQARADKTASQNCVLNAIAFCFICTFLACLSVGRSVCWLAFHRVAIVLATWRMRNFFAGAGKSQPVAKCAVRHDTMRNIRVFYWPATHRQSSGYLWTRRHVAATANDAT